MSPAIQVDRLSKHYRLGVSPRSELNLQESLTHGMRSIWRRLTGRGEPRRDFWALKDVSFEVNPGELLGIIGRNGAGKSTLLKLLSRVTDPTSGIARVRGRLGSLLEVGTGFHPELTGRENIYLNGSLLGMSRAEIRKKFDAIVAFAEIETFIDTPVKRFSSGMSVRLGFAIASHLEPDILILDEVLAVGDAAFQKKSLNKVREVAGQGRTILFVSHDLPAVRRLCHRAILLSSGTIAACGAVDEVVTHYLASDCNLLQPGRRCELAGSTRRGSGTARFDAIQIEGDVAGQPIVSNGSMNAHLWIHAEGPREVDSLSVILFDRSGNKLVNADTMTLQRPIQLGNGENCVHLRIHSLPLNPGTYTLGLWLAKRPVSVFDYIESAAEIEVFAPPDASPIRPNEDGVVWTDYTLVDAP